MFWRVHYWILGVGAGLFLSAVALPARANLCERGRQQPVPPTQTTRVFNSPQLGFSFEIPANYRAMGRTDNGVEFLDPATFSWRQCVIRHQIPTALPPRVMIEIRRVPSPDQNLEALVRQTRPWLSTYLPDYVALTLDDQPALQYRYTSSVSGQAYINYAFRSSNGQHLITLTGPENNSVLNLALESLNFEVE